MTCHFAEGSQALGCHVQINFSNDFHTWNISREDESLTTCVVLQVNTTCYPSDCNLSQGYIYDWEADGTVGTLSVPVETIFSEEASKACSTSPDTPTSGHIKPGMYCIEVYPVYGCWVCVLVIVTLAFVYAHTVPHTSVQPNRTDRIIARLWPHVEISLSIFPLSPHNKSTFQCLHTTVDREIFVVKIFSSARGATKIKRAKH